MTKSSMRIAKGARKKGPFASIDQAIEAIQAGRMIVVVDDEDRENEGDLTMAASQVTPAAINFMARHGRGLICLAMTPERLDQLEIPLEVSDNSSRRDTAMCVSIDARDRTTTASRPPTVRDGARRPDAASTPRDLSRPGHVFRCSARTGGVLVRSGHTEAPWTWRASPASTRPASSARS
jgi:3,4-dihydroxy 2-butanone 4-phosphate synthase/GTP cyclohydrolase II